MAFPSARILPFLTALPLTALLVLAACGEPEDTDSKETGDPGIPDDTGPEPVDEDGDGVTVGDGDCDDGDPDIHPGREEDCNGIDDNCNGKVDEGFGDSDDDGTADCLDSEECDGVDNDGDSRVDEDFTDTDGDGTADCVETEECDGVDNDGDGEVDEGFDADGDGYTTCGNDEDPEDCDDESASVHPGAEEDTGNTLDDDCDGLLDEPTYEGGEIIVVELMVNPYVVGDPDGEWIELYNASGQDLYLDGMVLYSEVGDESHTLTPDDPWLFEAGAYAVLVRNDNPMENGGVEADYAYADVSLSNESDTLTLYAGEVVLDSVSWDDGETMPDTAGASVSLDPGYYDAELNDDPTWWCAAPETWSEGSDLGSPGSTNPTCPTFDHDGDGYAEEEGDCDDEDDTIHPGATETWYDGVDQDCDEWSDYDADGDGYDIDTYFGGEDCDDDDPDVNPDATEVCDALNVDEDCNGLADDEDPDAEGTTTWYPDDDGDGYGVESEATDYCDDPPGHSLDYGDCDDDDATVNPDATEICGDSVDNDCDELAGDCGIVGEVSVANLSGTAYGSASGDYAGYALDLLGDFDGDGLPEYVVGAYKNADFATDGGSAYVLSGPLTGLEDLSDAATWQYGAEASADYAGMAVAGVGDVDSDGLDDLLVGAPYNDEASSNAGTAYLVLGASAVPGASSLSGADGFLLGESRGDYAGYDVDAGGDVNGDGIGDLLVGSPRDDEGDSNGGAGYVVHGPLTGTLDLTDAEIKLYGQSSDEQAGTTVAGIGDLDADGFDDIAVGGYRAEFGGKSETGAVYLLHGPASGLVAGLDADAILTGSERSDYVGRSLAGGGDLDGDGYDDFLVGATGAEFGSSRNDSGLAWVVFGPVTATSATEVSDVQNLLIYGEDDDHEAGRSVSPAGDVDGDGFEDVLVGARMADGQASESGCAYLLLGPLTAGTFDLRDADATLEGTTGNDYAGSAVSTAGDQDADGYDDILVGAYGNDDNDSQAGAVYFQFGGPGL